jgi:hypothetical protein
MQCIYLWHFAVGADTYGMHPVLPPTRKRKSSASGTHRRDALPGTDRDSSSALLKGNALWHPPGEAYYVSEQANEINTRHGLENTRKTTMPVIRPHEAG